MKRKYLKIIIVLAVLLLAVTAGLAIPAIFHPGKSTRATPVSEQPDAESYASNPGMLFPDNTEDADPMGQTPDTPVSESTSTPDASDPGGLAEITDSRANTGAGMDSNSGNPGNPDSPADTNLINQSWVETKIAQHRHRIADNDLEDFRNILGKLDMGHVQAILEGRITPDIPMEDTLRTYLRSRLTPAEYERAKELFVTYEHLLFG